MSDARLRLYTVATIVGFGITWASGIYLALIGFTGNPSDCKSSCWVGAAVDLVGGFLVLVCGYRAFFGFLAAAGVNTSKPHEQLEPGSTQEDTQILEAARELMSKRQIRRWRPVDMLEWSDRQNWYVHPLRRAGLRKPSKLVLSAGLRSRINIEDWRTLLNYYLHHYRMPRKGRYLAFSILSEELLLLAVLAAVETSLSFTLGRYASFLFNETFGPLFALVVLIRLGPKVRRIYLRLDTVIAESLDKDRLLACFEKIDGLHLPEIESTKKREGWVARLWPMPTITQRIENLKNNG